jgi:DNA-binding winged helix-turn-helix (wHTH) protein
MDTVMENILVISDETALAETLANEMPEYAFTHALTKDIGSYLHDTTFRLILIDTSDDITGSLHTVKAPLVKLTRPIRLFELVGLIHEKCAKHEYIYLSDNYRLSTQEKTIHSLDNATKVTLTEKETDLLVCLLNQKGEAVTRDVLLKDIWGYTDDIATHTLETHMYRLRGKLRQVDPNLDILLLEEGGYRIDFPPAKKAV